MSDEQIAKRIEALAHQIWESEGRPDGRHAEHWNEAERRVRSDTREGLKADEAAGDYEQDAPGRPKTASSREQTQPGQQSQTGSAQLDAAAARGTRKP